MKTGSLASLCFWTKIIFFPHVKKFRTKKSIPFSYFFVIDKILSFKKKNLFFTLKLQNWKLQKMKLFFKNFFHIFSSWEKSGGYWICRPNQKPQFLKMHGLVVFLFLKKTKNVFHISIKTIVFHTNFYHYEQKTKFITSLSWDSFVPVGISIIFQTNEDSYWNYFQILFFFFKCK